jgi:hypothetical protein
MSSGGTAAVALAHRRAAAAPHAAPTAATSAALAGEFDEA